MNPLTVGIQNELVEVRINIVRVLQGIAGDRVSRGECDTPEQELELWRAKERLAEARIKLFEMSTAES